MAPSHSATRPPSCVAGIIAMILPTFVLLFGLLIAPPTSALAASLSGVDSVLDRLEKRLLDQEADGLTFGERQNDPAFLRTPEAAAPKKTYRFGSTKIEATPKQAERLKDVGKLVAELEGQVEQLASSVQKTKQSVVDDAAIDNFVTLAAQLGDTDTATIKNLTVKLDGFDLYALSDSSGLWLPSKNLPIYAGPLQPGNHRVDLEVRLVMRQEQNLPLNGDIYRFINKSFDITVTGARSNARYIIAIKAPDKLGDSADATLKEAL